jgi:hypothetical protein
MTERETAVIACCQAGLSVNQTARELGLTPGQVTAVRKRLNLTFPAGRSCDANLPANYHDAIADMRPLDAVEYLTHLLDQLLWQGRAHGVEPIAGCRLTQKEAQLAYFLHQQGGRVVPTEAIMHALYSDRASGDMPDTGVIGALACNIRRKLQPHVTITRTDGGTVLQLAPGSELDWRRGIAPAVRFGLQIATRAKPWQRTTP